MRHIWYLCIILTLSLLESINTPNEIPLSAIIGMMEFISVSAAQCSAVQCSGVQCSAVQCSVVQCSALQDNAKQC